MSDTTWLDEIREADARDMGIPWSGPGAEKAEEFVAHRHMLLVELDRVNSALVSIEVSAERAWHKGYELDPAWILETIRGEAP